MKANKCKIGLWVLATYVCRTVITTLLLWGVYSIPREKLYPQMVSSVSLLEEEGKYPSIPYFRSKVRDNYSDAAMLNIAFGAQEGTLMDNLRNAMRSNEPMTEEEIEGLKLAVSQYPNIPESVPYGRYWHGYQVYLRPLLTVFDLSQLRIINYILLFGITCIMLRLMWRKLGMWYALMMLLALLSVAYPWVPQCMHFSSIFYVGMISMIVSMLIAGRTNEPVLRPILFFLSGAITSCLDLLTAPMIPLVLLLLTDTLMHKYEGTTKQQFWRRIGDLVGYGVIWCVGYALFWVTKFAVGSLILDTNLFVDGLNQTATRMDASFVPFSSWALKVLVFPFKHNYTLLLSGMAVMYVFLRWNKYRLAIINNAWLLVVAMIEPVWLLLLRQHTVIHYVIFVWRSEIILVLCLSLFVYRVISQTKANEKSIQ